MIHWKITLELAGTIPYTSRLTVNFARLFGMDDMTQRVSNLVTGKTDNGHQPMCIDHDVAPNHSGTSRSCSSQDEEEKAREPSSTGIARRR